MTINIPSKNIYQKQDNKVIKNKITKVSATNTTLVQEYASGAIGHYAISSFTSQTDYGADNIDFQQGDDGTVAQYRRYFQTYAYVGKGGDGNLYFNSYGQRNITFTIPKKQSDKTVINGNAENSEIAIYCKKTTYSAQGTLHKIDSNGNATTGVSAGAIDENRSYIDNFSFDNSNPVVVERLLVDKDELNKPTEEYKPASAVGEFWRTATAQIDITTKSYDWDTHITITDLGENLSVEMSTVAGLTTVKLHGSQRGYASDFVTMNVLHGSFIVYQPIQVEFTINGEFVRVNLQTEEVTFGTGDKPIALNGNELLNDSTSLAEEVLTQFANGKETATIKCAITDYYDTVGNLVISTNCPDFFKHTSFVVGALSVTGEVDTTIDYRVTSDFVEVPQSNTYYRLLRTNYNTETKSDTGFVMYAFYDENKTVIPYLDFRVLSAPNEIIVPEQDSEGQIDRERIRYIRICLGSGVLSDNPVGFEDIGNVKLQRIIDEKPMTFNTGDTAIPYVRNSQGQDVPMSTKNGEPKQFEVVGVKLICNGTLWQELTLIEKPS